MIRTYTRQLLKNRVVQSAGISPNDDQKGFTVYHAN